MLKFKDIELISLKENSKSISEMFGISNKKWDYHVKRHEKIDKEEGGFDLKKHILLAYDDSDSAQEFMAILCLIFRSFGVVQGANDVIKTICDRDPMTGAMMKIILKSELEQFKKN